MKTRVFNVIVLDKSGSMSSIARQAIDGVNETIGSIKSAQEKNPDQEHMVTLVAFCGCEMRSIYDNVPVAEVQPLTDKDYCPCCMDDESLSVGAFLFSQKNFQIFFQSRKELASLVFRLCAEVRKRR